MNAPSVSLRHNFAWTFAGYAVLGASQWAVLSLIAKLGSTEMLGQYALALALALPVSMLSHLNLRIMLATDVDYRHGFGDYLAVRAVATALALAGTTVAALAAAGSREVSGALLFLGFSLGADNVSETLYGALQREERMKTIAHSMALRGSVSVAALAVILRLTGELVPAVAALAAGRVLVLVVFDFPRATRGHNLARSGLRAQWEILRTALPLGVVLMLVSLTSNVPRYAVEALLGTRQLGVFAAVAVFLNAGNTLANALGQSAAARLARFYRRRDLVSFRRLTAKLTGLAALMGAGGVLLAALAGRTVLRVAYRAELAEHAGLLVTVMVAGTFVYVAVILGYAITSARSFVSQMPLLALVAATSAGASWLVIPSAGLTGAALAVALAACVQIGGELVIFFRALRRAEAR